MINRKSRSTLSSPLTHRLTVAALALSAALPLQAAVTMTGTSTTDYDNYYPWYWAFGLDDYGEIKVDNGSSWSWTGNPASAPNTTSHQSGVIFARRTGSSGYGLITGTNSQMNLVGNNGNTYFQVGRGGTATLDINNGGSLNITDPSVVSTNTDASLTLSIGGSNSQYFPHNGTGTLNANNGHILLEGNESSLLLGWGEGKGSMNLTNGSTLTIRDHAAVGSNIGAFASLGIGMPTNLTTPHNELIIDNSIMTMSSDHNDAGIVVGQAALGVVQGQPHSGILGRMTVTGATASVDITAAQDSAYINVGRNTHGTYGELNVKDNAQVNLTGFWAGMNISRNDGTSGALNITNGGQINLVGTNTDVNATKSHAFVGYARDNDNNSNTPRVGGTGTALVSGNGSSLSTNGKIVVGTPVSFGGTGANSKGTLTVNDGATITAGQGVIVGVGGTLNGDAIINGNVINDGGLIAPGNSPGTMTIHGDYTQNVGSTLEMEINGGNPGDYDVLIIDGTSFFDTGSIINLVFSDGFLADLLSGAEALNTVDLDNMFSFGSASNFTTNLIMASAAGYKSISFSFDTNGALASLSASPVPIPAMLPLFAFSLLGLGFARKAKAKV